MNPGLGRRIAFTLGALIVYRIGTFIPLPGIDPDGLSQLLGRGAAGGLHRVSILAFGIQPYVTAAVLVQLFTLMLGVRSRLDVRGERGARVIERFTLGLSAVFVINESLGIALSLEGYGNFVSEPGWLFRVSTVATLTGGTFFLIWLSHQITLRGVGNGLALILLTGVVAELPRSASFDIARAIEFGGRGVRESNLVLAGSAFLVAFIGFVVFMELARRHVLVEYPGQPGHRNLTSNLSLKINGAGFYPLMLVPWLLLLPTTVVNFFYTSQVPDWLAAQFGHGRPLFVVYNVVLIIFLSLLYVAFVLDPANVAEKLKRYGGIIPGVEPGEATAAHIDRVVSRTSILGAAYLALVAVTPEILIAYAPVTFYFSATSLFLVVGVVLDIRARVRADMRLNSPGSAGR